MRKIAGSAFLVGAATAVLGILWLDRAIAVAQMTPSPICRTHALRDQIIAGRVPLAEQDRLVGETINFATGSTQPGLSWHLRGAAIQLGYRLVWHADRRRAVFAGVAAQMEDCSSYEVAAARGSS